LKHECVLLKCIFLIFIIRKQLQIWSCVTFLCLSLLRRMINVSVVRRQSFFLIYEREFYISMFFSTKFCIGCIISNSKIDDLIYLTFDSSILSLFFRLLFDGGPPINVSIRRHYRSSPTSRGHALN
jgi:hypothetical protein